MPEAVNLIFEDRVMITAVDSEGKKFDRVSRLNGTSQNMGMTITLDINCEIYPVRANETLTLAIVRQLVPEELADVDEDDVINADDQPKKIKRELWRGGDQGLAADYEYVMYGKIYKFDDSKSETDTTAYFSFGGLLLAVRGDYRHLANVVVGENVYLLIRK